MWLVELFALMTDMGGTYRLWINHIDRGLVNIQNGGPQFFLLIGVVVWTLLLLTLIASSVASLPKLKQS
ncbi:MAG: hypothetical protein R3C18_17685 [Planctomycetaceae bacterium]